MAYQIGLLAVQTAWLAREAAIALRGELDHTNASALRPHLARVVDRAPTRLDIELSGLSFIDCAGARALTWPRRVLPEGCPVVLCGPGPSARRVLELTGAADGCVIEYLPPPRRRGRVIG